MCFGFVLLDYYINNMFLLVFVNIGVSGSPLKLSAPPVGRFGIMGTDQGSQSLRRPRASPSPTLPSPRRHSDTSDSDLRGDSHEQVFYLLNSV